MVRASGPCGQGTAKRLVWLEEEPNAGQDSGGLHPTGPLIGRERHSQGAVKRRLPTAQAATKECSSGHLEVLVDLFLRRQAS